MELLLEQNESLCKVAGSLVNLLEDHTEIDKLHREISLLEEEADRIYVSIGRHLSQTFITPMDREDLLHINKAQEDAIDLMRDTANRLHIFEFKRIRFPLFQLARSLVEMAALTNSMLRGLSRKKDSHDTKAFRVLRDECEMLLGMGVAELNDLQNPTVQDLLGVHKWSQIYDRMELAVARVVELAETIEEAVLKYV